MKDYMLEVCVDSVESAMAAVRGGAMRLELCQDLIVGGTTPSLELFRMIREKSSIPVHILIRPRFGDFCYTAFEYERMCREISDFVEAGAEGVVIGSLDPEGNLNLPQMRGMINAADGRKITLHRAFDVCADPFAVMEAAKDLGIHTILTSGQEKDCLTGCAMLKKLAQRTEGKIRLLAGAGIGPAVIPKIWKETGIRDYHMSGKKILDSRMRFRNPRVSMGLSGISEFSVWQTDEQTVREAVNVLKNL